MAKRSNKKSLVVFALALTAAFLTGCQNDNEPKPDVTSGGEENTKFEISQSVTDIGIGEDDATDGGEESFIPKLLMDTDKPFVRAEENYIIEKQDIDLSKLDDYNRREFHDGKFYYSSFASYENSGSKAEIWAYDIKSGELTTYYSETPETEGFWVDLDIRLIDEAYLYFYREAFQTGTENMSFQLVERELYMVDLRDNNVEKIFSYADEEVMPSGSSVVSAGDILYIPTIHEALNNYKFMLFQYDMNTGEASLFRDYADYPVPYNNGIVYYHDNSFYYHGAADIKGQGAFYEGDELVFDSAYDGLFEDLFSDFGMEELIYVCAEDKENFYSSGFDLGIFDEDFNRVLIARTKKDTWVMQVGGVSTSGLVSVSAPKPLIYDLNKECFAVIPIDFGDYYYFVNEDELWFLGYEWGNDSAVLYTVRRK